MSTLSTHIRKSNVKPHPNLRSKMPAGTENIVAFSRLKGPRVPKLPQLGLVLRGTVGRSFWPHFHSHAILNNSHRLWLSVLFERQFRNQSFFFCLMLWVCASPKKTLYERDDQYTSIYRIPRIPNQPQFHSSTSIAEGVVTSIVEWGAFVELDKDGWCAAVLPWLSWLWASRGLQALSATWMFL